MLGVTRARDRTVETTSSRRSECGHRFDGTSLGLEARSLTTRGTSHGKTTRPTWDEFKAQLEAAIQELIDAQDQLTEAQNKLAAQDRLGDLVDTPPDSTRMSAAPENGLSYVVA